MRRHQRRARRPRRAGAGGSGRGPSGAGAPSGLRRRRAADASVAAECIQLLADAASCSRHARGDEADNGAGHAEIVCLTPTLALHALRRSTRDGTAAARCLADSAVELLREIVGDGEEEGTAATSASVAAARPELVRHLRGATVAPDLRGTVVDAPVLEDSYIGGETLACRKGTRSLCSFKITRHNPRLTWLRSVTRKWHRTGDNMFWFFRFLAPHVVESFVDVQLTVPTRLRGCKRLCERRQAFLLCVTFSSCGRRLVLAHQRPRC